MLKQRLHTLKKNINKIKIGSESADFSEIDRWQTGKKYNISTKFKSRHIGRVIAFQTLFAYDYEQRSADEILKFDWIRRADVRPDAEPNNDETNITLFEELFGEVDDWTYRAAVDYARFLVEGTLRNLDEIDNLITAKLRNWSLDRISSIDRAIMRFAVFSILYENDLDESIIINEAVEIVKEFGSKESYKFVNGILDAIKKDKKQNKANS